MIYSHLLSCQQKIHLPLAIDDEDIIRYTNEYESNERFAHEVTHPRLKRPDENISVKADASFFPRISKPNTRRISLMDGDEQVAHQSAVSRWHALHRITAKKDLVNGVAILRTCRQVYEEAEPMLYPRCIFVFPVNATLKTHGEDKAIRKLFKQMQHVELHLDLPVVYLRHYSTLAEAYTANTW